MHIYIVHIFYRLPTAFRVHIRRWVSVSILALSKLSPALTSTECSQCALLNRLVWWNNIVRCGGYALCTAAAVHYTFEKGFRWSSEIWAGEYNTQLGVVMYIYSGIEQLEIGTQRSLLAAAWLNRYQATPTHTCTRDDDVNRSVFVGTHRLNDNVGLPNVQRYVDSF